MTIINAYAIPGIKRDLVLGTPDEIVIKVSDYFKVPLTVIKTRVKGNREVIYARDWVVWFLLKETKLTLKEVGKLLGNRDHSTIIYAREKIRARLYDEKLNIFDNYKDDYKKLTQII